MGAAGSKSSKQGWGEQDSDVTKVSSGFRSEKNVFTWRIENFDVVRQSKEQISAQKFEFQIGETIGLPCLMSCYLQYTDEPAEDETGYAKSWIGLNYNLVRSPETVPHVPTQMEVEVINKFGQRIINLNGGIADLVNNKEGWGFAQVIDQNARADQLPLIDGCLVINIKFTIFAPNPTITYTGSLLRLRNVDEHESRAISKSLQNLLRDFGKLLEEEALNPTGEATSSANYSDVKIITRDRVFKAHKAILSARSPVFTAMFRNDVVESDMGAIRIDDLSSATVRILLQFIYTGTLPHNWSKAEIIVELTSAAAKYELQDLLEFLDRKLGSVCDEQSAGKLLLLASRLHLSKAEKEILAYIKHHGVRKSKDFISIVKNIASTPEVET